MGESLEGGSTAVCTSATSWPLAWNEGLARALVAHSADVILVLTADHRCLFANPAMFDVLGYPPDAVLGQDIIPLHHPDDLPLAVTMLKAAAANPGLPARCQIRLHHRDGSWRWMAVTATNRLHDPAVLGIVCNLHNVTAHVESALESEEALRQEEQARFEQERVAQAKSEFLRMLGHEFKTPLTVIAGNADLLELELEQARDRFDPAGVHESTQAIRNEARHLTGLLDDLLLLDRIDAHRLVLRLQPVDINALAAETIARIRAVEPNRSFIEALWAAPAQIQGDGERLRQVVDNLLANAVKYSSPQDSITVSTCIEGDGLWLRVSDKGIGIAEEDVQLIFDRYHRARSGEQRGISGSGLGLSIVNEITRLHGGRVQAESALGNGTTVSVWLPFTPHDDDDALPLP